MRLLNWYVTRGFLGAFFMSILVLTFAMTGANLVKVMDYVSKGVPVIIFLKFTLYILPIILTFTVPWAVMVAVMLVFGRMSADNEITAMRACGVSILQIVSPLLIITVGLTALCLYLQVEIGPPLLGKSRSMMEETVATQPLSLFAPGQPVNFKSGDHTVVISIDDKEGETGLRGVLFCKTDSKGNLEQEIAAETGEVIVDKERQELTVTLHECIIANHVASEEQRGVERIFSNETQFRFDYGKEANSDGLSIRSKYMKLSDLLGEIRMTKQARQDTTELEVELNQRIAFSLAPIAFLLLGIPMAIRTNRRETSVGLFLSVILAGFFFLSIIIMESLSGYPKLYPQYLLWLPNVIFQVLGAILTYRISQR